jgi:hypothetical protein
MGWFSTSYLGKGALLVEGASLGGLMRAAPPAGKSRTKCIGELGALLRAEVCTTHDLVRTTVASAQQPVLTAGMATPLRRSHALLLG